MKKAKLPTSAKNPTARKIRKAIGVSDTAPVNYTMRPRDRDPRQPPPSPPPDMAGFEALHKLTGKELTALGLGAWDGKIWLFPGDWYDHIPEGFPIENISNKKSLFERGKTPSDLGFGMLAFGIRIKPARRERKH